MNALEQATERLSPSVRSLDAFYDKAYRLMTSQAAKEAFDISREPDKVRADYGMTSLGQCCLLGRRMVEAGCRFVSIENGHWDTHRKNTWSLRELLCPAFDNAIPALLSDLQQRGMLESTLVVVTTEFGRTPRINQLLGRDHWPHRLAYPDWPARAAGRWWQSHSGTYVSCLSYDRHAISKRVHPCSQAPAALAGERVNRGKCSRADGRGRPSYESAANRGIDRCCSGTDWDGGYGAAAPWLRSVGDPHFSRRRAARNDDHREGRN
jgi:hypothetical protein